MGDNNEAKKIWRLGIEKYFLLLQGTGDKYSLESLDEEWTFGIGL
jgi:hypothetical protein